MAVKTFSTYTIETSRDKTNDMLPNVRKIVFLAGNMMQSLEICVKAFHQHLVVEHDVPIAAVRMATSIAFARMLAESMFTDDGPVETSVEDEIAHVADAAARQYRLFTATTAN